MTISTTAVRFGQIIGLSFGYYGGDYVYNRYDAYFNGMHRIRVPIELLEIQDIKRTENQTSWTNMMIKSRGDRFIEK
jgi:hypothetical protein